MTSVKNVKVGDRLTTCTYTEDVWVCENGTLVLHPEAREQFWLHDTSEITACPACEQEVK